MSQAWDRYFKNVAESVAYNSRCLSRQIGAVMVTPDRSIVSTGYNGPPRGHPHCWTLEVLTWMNIRDLDDINKVRNDGVCPRRVLGYKSGQGLDLCPAGHAERNALINAAREGIRTKGNTLYLTCGIPCKDCMIETINAGIAEIVVANMDIYDRLSLLLVHNSGIVVRKYSHL